MLNWIPHVWRHQASQWALILSMVLDVSGMLDVADPGRRRFLSVVPFAFQLLDSIVGVAYGHLLGEQPLVLVRSFGVAFSAVALIFLAASPPKGQTKGGVYSALVLSVLVAGALVFGAYQAPQFVDAVTEPSQVLAPLSTSLHMLFSAAPLITSYAVVSERDSSSMPRAMVLANLATSVAWAIWAMTPQPPDMPLALSSAWGVGVCLVGGSLLLCFPSTKADKINAESCEDLVEGGREKED